MSRDDLVRLLDRLRAAGPQAETLQTNIEPFFSKFSWFEEVQRRLIKSVLASETQPGFNVWADLLTFLDDSTNSAE